MTLHYLQLQLAQKGEDLKKAESDGKSQEDIMVIYKEMKQLQLDILQAELAIQIA